MRISIALFAVLVSHTAAAAIPAGPPFALKNMVPATPSPPMGHCDVKNVQQPAAPTPLPSPATGNTLSMIAIGRGTQNYTCADSTAGSVPAADGALATLYDGSCIARSSPSTLAAVTSAVQRIALDSVPSQMVAAGHHYFFDVTTPTFDMTSIGLQYVKKGAASNAPGAANGDVPWLYLKTAPGTPASASGIREVYRLNTANGAAPKTCEGQPASFEVQYSAEYWFYTAPPPS